MVFNRLSQLNSVEENDIYEAVCQYYMAAQESLPHQLRNPGSQGFLAWSACNHYLCKHQGNLSQGGLAYLHRIQDAVDKCSAKLMKDINAQISAELKPLNLFSHSKLAENQVNELLLRLQDSGCIDQNAVLKGNWNLLYRSDGRFFIVQNEPAVHLTDIVAKDLPLAPPVGGIGKAHITVNEGQAVKREEMFQQLGWNAELLSTNDAIMRDNAIMGDARNSYFFVKNELGQPVSFKDIKLTTVSVISNPRPEVKSIFIFDVKSESLDLFKEKHDVYPPNRMITPHISLGSEFRTQEVKLGEQQRDALLNDLGGTDSVEGGLLLRMWP